MKVRTRMAPSPTGELHIGGLRTLLYDYALARKNNGQFIMRIEDTDQKRYVDGSEKRLMDTVKSFGIHWDEGPDIGGKYGPYTQTERLDIYKKYIQELLDKDLAYYCFCTETRLEEVRNQQKLQGKVPKYDRHCLNLSPEEVKKKIDSGESYVIRMKIPDNETIVFEDIVRGEIKFKSNDVDDQVLIKSNGIPTYHFAVVVDDHLMEITHVFRGEEWISSTPKHVLLYRYFGWKMPSVAHLTVLLDPEGRGKMSKRHGSTHAQAFLSEGYLPEAILNFLMLLGWNPGNDQEIISLEEFIELFDIKHLNKKPVAFDRKKLDYFNGHYIRQKDNAELADLLEKYIPANKEIRLILAPLLKERINKLSDATQLTEYIFNDISIDKELLLQKGGDLTKKMLIEAMKSLKTVNDWSTDKIQSELINTIQSHGFHTGKFFMAFRITIAGVPITPPIVETLPILGKEKTIDRLEKAINLLD